MSDLNSLTCTSLDSLFASILFVYDILRGFAALAPLAIPVGVFLAYRVYKKQEQQNKLSKAVDLVELGYSEQLLEAREFLKSVAQAHNHSYENVHPGDKEWEPTLKLLNYYNRLASAVLQNVCDESYVKSIKINRLTEDYELTKSLIMNLRLYERSKNIYLPFETLALRWIEDKKL